MKAWSRRPTAAFRRAFRAVRRGVEQFHTRWRRSLQIRIVATTLVISAVVVAVLGFFLMREMVRGLLTAKENVAFAQTAEGLGLAQRELGGVPAGEAEEDWQAKFDKLGADLARRSGPGGLYEVVLFNSDTTSPLTASGKPGRVSYSLDPRSVPQRLRNSIRGDKVGRLHMTYTSLSYIDREESDPGLVVGARVLGPYELYYLFPLTEEEGTAALMQRAVIAVGAVLVLLLAAIASLVTRQVVAPVRAAAQSAERLATGMLDERMRVRGEDDLARLATSFNGMAATLQEKIRELEELSKVQRQFVSDVSHELRTPLTTIRMAADLLHEQRTEFDPAVARSAELLQTQLERFESLLGDLLEISRYDAGAATLDAESLDVRDLVLRAVGDAESLAEHQGSKVVLQLPGEPVMAEVDRRRIERVLRNLLVNAVEHGEGKDIVVTVADDRDAVAVAVRDYGVGIRRGAAQLVFDRFWRADPARARTTGGTGLGLSISREDAQLHGGWLQAWGEPGVGSQFRLTLPRRQDIELRGSPLPLVPPEIAIGAPRQRAYGQLEPSGGGDGA
jgi:two-component system, OmpR family, sensor histidine kinase MtrB